MDWLFQDPSTRFLIQIVVIIAACRGLGLVARRIGQPVVIAEVAAGIVLGPSLLGWLAPDAFHELFPPGSLGVVRTVSQLGLVMFMFLIGLELDVRLLRGRGRTAVMISQTSIVVPFALGWALAWVGYETLAPAGVAFPVFAMFMGVAMSITAFPVLARILSEQRLMRTRVGTVAIASAAIGDVTAWCLLAFAVALARPRDVVDAVITTVLAATYIAGMLMLVRPVLSRIAARVTSPGAMSQNLVALVLLVVIVSSLITHRIGIHLLFGAFLVGVVLPKEGGFARAIAEKLEDVVVILLVPLFFAVSGLRTEIGLVATPDQAIYCGVIIVVATAGKLGGGALAARFGGMSWREAGAVGVLMNTRGLMELVALNIALDLGVIGPALFSMMVIMALVTTFITTPMLEAIYPSAVMARDLIDDDEARPAVAAAPPRVLACISHASAGPGLVSMARCLAGDGGEVTGLHLASPAERASALVGDPGDDATPAELVGALDQARELGITLRPLSFVSADPAEDIARVADVREVDLILLGLHKPVLSQTLLGGVIHEVMQQARSTVAVFAERRSIARPARVLVPFHGSPHDRAALALAQRIQQGAGGEVEVLHVERPGESAIEAALARAPDFDLVVVGVGATWGLGERKLGFGLHPERLIRDCPTSVLIVRGEPAPLAPARVTRD